MAYHSWRWSVSPCLALRYVNQGSICLLCILKVICLQYLSCSFDGILQVSSLFYNDLLFFNCCVDNLGHSIVRMYCSELQVLLYSYSHSSQTLCVWWVLRSDPAKSNQVFTLSSQVFVVDQVFVSFVVSSWVISELFVDSQVLPNHMLKLIF